jgi:hypothetical protein
VPPGTESSDARVGHLHALRRLPHGALAAAIIPRRRRRARVPEQRLYRGQVHTRVEQIAHERAPAVMGREGCDACARREVTKAVVHRLLGEPPGLHPPVAVHGQQQRAGLAAAHPEPGVQRVGARRSR